jgi:predicted protein tyrosine phosphatase
MRMLRRGQSAIPPSLDGISVVAYLNFHSRKKEEGCWLLLGSVRNALAAVSTDSPVVFHSSTATTTATTHDNDTCRTGDTQQHYRICITHIVSVADSGKCAAVRQKGQEQNSSLPISCHFMADRLQPDQVVDLKRMTAPAIATLETVVGFSTKDTTAHNPQKRISLNTSSTLPQQQRGVLVHCNEGHNRSPTLVLSYLLQCGLSLRDAYKLVLRARPTVDPLPPYRQALWNLEQEIVTSQQSSLLLSQSSTISHNVVPSVQPEEHFHLHMSQLKDKVLQRQEQQCNNQDDDDDPNHHHVGNTTKDVAKIALEWRQNAIEKLLAETCKP